MVAGKPNPFNKYAQYYGTQKPPLIIKDAKGRWMPAKIWPHSVGNIKKDIPPSGSIQFRWPEGETRDAYYVIGTVDNLPANNKHLLWLEIEQAAHPFGKARPCDSCHKENQVSISTWEYYGYQGAEPFEGTYTLLADKTGLYIRGISNTTPIELLEGSQLSDFAPWLFVKDKWSVPGDFSIKTDREKYNDYLGRYDASYGWFLKILDNGQFEVVPPVRSGFQVHGEIRDMEVVTVGKKRMVLVGINNQKPEVFLINDID